MFLDFYLFYVYPNLYMSIYCIIWEKHIKYNFFFIIHFFIKIIFFLLIILINNHNKKIMKGTGVEAFYLSVCLSVNAREVFGIMMQGETVYFYFSFL